MSFFQLKLFGLAAMFKQHKTKTFKRQTGLIYGTPVVLSCWHASDVILGLNGPVL